MEHPYPGLNDKWWRLTHLYKIIDKEGRLVTFNPKYTQLKHLAERRNRRRIRLLKYRQGGFTTLYCIDYLDDALFNSGFMAGIIAHKQGTLDLIFQIVETAFDNLPPSIKPTTRQDTLRMLRFEKDYMGRPLNSGIYVALELRGGTLQALHVSERAFITGKKSQELEAGAKQAVPLTGRISEETTANGLTEFYDAFTSSWQKPTQNELDYLSMFYAWHEEVEYTLPGEIDEYTEKDLKLKQLVRDAYKGKELTDGQILWYRWKENEIAGSAEYEGLRPEQVMKQEYPSTWLEAFQSGSGNVFDVAIIEKVVTKRPLRVTPTGITVWVEPVKRGDHYIDEEDGIAKQRERDFHYVLGGDPSGGTTDDATGLSIWCVETREQCAQYVGHPRPDEAAEIARDMCEMYNNAFAGIENNMLSLILFFSKIYDNYYSVTVPDEKFDRRTKKIGWNTNSKTRDPMIDEFIMAFEEGTLIINSPITLAQMRTFVKKENGKREHADGKQDDALFADMIAVQMFKHYNSRHKARVFAVKPAGL